MRNTLFIVSLYLILSACGEKSNEVKFISEGNPIVTDKFTADPAPMVHNGRLYLYVGHDEAEEGQDFNITEWLCYSTKDMKTWTDHGSVLKPTDFSWGVGEAWASQVVEKDGKFYYYTTVQAGAPYNSKVVGVAVSDSPTGPFIDARGTPLITDDMTPNGPRGWWNDIDPTVFVDDDGRAYQFYSSENNATMYISLLTDDYLKPSGRFTRNFVKESREAPAVFKYDGKYYMLSSGCTGWDPNVAEIAVADSIMGTWKTIGNPCTGPDADKTFYAQSTYVQPVIGKKDAYIAMFDRWKKKDLEDSRYVWLPVLIKDGKITIPWHEKWDFSIFDK